MIPRIPHLLLGLLLTATAYAQNSKVKAFDLNQTWIDTIEQLAPTTALVAPKEKRSVFVYTEITGFKHWATPHTAEVVRILGEKTGAYDALISDDISYFEKDKIQQFDTIVLINNCSKRPDRHLFFDVLQDMDKAVQLEKNLINHVAAGNGLVAIHGAIVMLNNSEAFSDTLGGSFDYHPKQTTVRGKVLDHSHAISGAFEGKDLVHTDEPYCFKGAYYDFNFHPLLQMELPDVTPEEQEKLFKRSKKEVKRYISWIKPHGNGRVFYCSPSHNAQSFENPKLLQFVLNGIQYTNGDLECDDTPLQPTK